MQFVQLSLVNPLESNITMRVSEETLFLYVNYCILLGVKNVLLHGSYTTEHISHSVTTFSKVGFCFKKRGWH